MTEREQQILDLIKLDPMIAQSTLADMLNISRSAVAGHITNLTRKGFIQGKGYLIAPDRFAVVIGGANMDLCGRSCSDLVMGSSNPGTLTASAGGVGRTIAENIARLGSKVEFVSAVGEDLWGEQLLDSCRDADVGVEHCLIVPGRATSTYLSIQGPDGQLQVALNDMALFEELNAERLAKRSPLLNRATIIAVDANLTESALEHVFQTQAAKPIFVDPVSVLKAEKIKPFLSCIHTLKLELAEAELLAGYPASQHHHLPKIANKLHDMGVKQLVISLGNKGVFSSQDRKGHFHTCSDSTVNLTTDGREGLLAGLVHGYLQSTSWQQSVEYALVSAGLAPQNDYANLLKQGRHGSQYRTADKFENDADLGLYYD
ncbi:PfkB family carbohydrate kinase [Vibrio sp. 10N]|uniref:PfkB family carbohydrate kinase n=1 Tax=Vibrio sp. 10N TaxID=3058938 RepID=UPI0030C7031F